MATGTGGNVCDRLLYLFSVLPQTMEARPIKWSRESSATRAWAPGFACMVTMDRRQGSTTPEDKRRHSI
eukprot:12899945-Prorocentrum_lima.AAC.1